MHRGWRWLAVLAVVVSLSSVPITLYISGRVRTAKTNELCRYTQHNWDASHAFIFRFTSPGSADRIDALAILKPRPQC